MTFSAEEGRPGEAEAFAMRLLDTSGPEKARGAKRCGGAGDAGCWLVDDFVMKMVGDDDF